MSAVFTVSQHGALARSPLGEVANWPQSLRTSAQLVLNSPLPMLLLWGEQLTQIYNDSFAALAGNKHPGAFGQPMQRCWPEFGEYSQPIIDAVLAGENRSYTDQYYVLPDQHLATELWLDLTFSPVFDEADKVAGILMIAVQTSRRRTAIKRTAQALRELNDTLEERVTERTQALAEANDQLQREMIERERIEDTLRHAQKMEAVGQLTGGIAHDFNNMLTGIIASLDLAKRYIAAGRSDEIGRFTDAAVASAQRAAALTHRLLAFSRRQALDRKPLDPNALVISLQELFSRTKGSHIDLKVELGKDIWAVNTDTGQLESALLNLIINSLEALGDNDEQHREIELLSHSGEGGVWLTVRDHGAGMTEEQKKQAFEPFYTGKPTGTGLGLALVHKTMREHEGKITLDSVCGKGTTVSLFFPNYVAGKRADQENPGIAAEDSASQA